MVQPAQKIVSFKEYSPVTPMMRQYLDIKKEHEDCLLFYRMGDFYELFLEDAVLASQALDIALTRRGKHEGQDIPMCGVPVHSSTSYLNKLIKKGFRVAVCEQVEDPKEAKKRGSKAVVKREVTRIITPGTITEESLLESKSSSFLLSINRVREDISCSWLDISTGDFFVSTVDLNTISSELSRVSPKEIIISERLLEDNDIYSALDDWRGVITPYAQSLFDSSKGERKIKDFYSVSSLDSFGDFSKSELGSCGALIEYIGLTQKDQIPRLSIPKRFQASNFMTIDASTRKSLELIRTLSGEYKGSLLHSIDRTATAAGARLLYAYLSSPLLISEEINARLDAVSFFVNKKELGEEIKRSLASFSDIERSLSRLHIGRGSPRDVASIRDGLSASLEVSEILELKAEIDYPDVIKSIVKELGNHTSLLKELHEALNDEVGINVREGGFVKEGYNPKLDEYRSATENAENLKNELKEKYIKETNISSLKIKENNVLGMFIEVNSQHSSKVLDSFVHRQTLAGVVRYTTQELRELEHKIINSKGYALQLEVEIFENLRSEVIKTAENIIKTANAIAKLDVASSLAELAVERGYTRPKIDESLSFEVESGRHPVVELYTEEDFVSNDCNLSEDSRFWLLTGPNMAGKSTFLRQNAIIAILAQMGSFVPANSAHIGVIDRVFSRVGASDDLSKGQSTFMVEMVETATILNHATDRSLVILDEVGRGTATYDGLSIAWSVLEFLHNKIKCRGLFATHYHELTSLANNLENLSCHTVQVKEWDDKVIFLHKVIEGNAERSYGIHVGKLAGIPDSVIKRAEEVLKTLESEDSSLLSLERDLPLFSSSAISKEDKVDRVVNELKEEIKNANPDEMTPKQAMDFLYRIRDKVS